MEQVAKMESADMSTWARPILVQAAQEAIERPKKRHR